MQGNTITNTTHIGLINPYRYRSYRYDSETGLYYLNSRYYDAQWGRFLNGDNYGGKVGDLLSHNIYTYCLNNPINKYDPDGHFAWALPWAIPTIIKAATATAGFVAGLLGGAAVIDATQAKAQEKATTKAKSEPITKTPPKPTQYWLADNNAVPKAPLTYSQAKITIATDQNVMCVNQVAALALVGTYPNRVIDKAHHGGDTGYYNHYHLNNNTSYPHIWFDSPIVLEKERVRNDE